MTMTALTGVPLLLTLFASAGVRAEEPAAASAGPSGPLPSPAPPINSAWISRAWQSDDGLPGNRVVGVAQTPDGFVRVATESGLARFDGVQFREAASAGVIAPSGSRIVGFLADSRGRLWLGKLTSTAGGAVVCVEAGRTRLFTGDDGLIDSPVMGLVEDGEGAVWATSPDGVCRIHQGRIRSFAGKAGLTGSGPTHLAMDGRGRLWFAEQRRVGVYREGAFRTLLTLGESHTALSGAKSGGIWICVGKRVLKYTGEGEPQDLGELAPNRPEVKPNIVCEDRRGWLWVGTGKTGLFLHNGSGFQLVDRPSHEILSLAQDRESNLWAGTDGGGLVRVKSRAFNLEVLSSDSPEGMRSVCQDTDGSLWAVTLSGRLAQKKGSLWRVLSAQDGWSGPAATCVTPAPEGGQAIRRVRSLDFSKRPWDNGFGLPDEPGDCHESHPYHFDNANFKLADLAYADPTGDRVGNGNAHRNNDTHAVVINEYGWLWLNRDGTPTTLTRKLYENLLGKNSTTAQRRHLYARTLAAETEFWRCNRKVAAVLDFCALADSRANGQTSDHWVDVAKLTWEPEFYRYVRDAFAPVGLMIDAWAEDYPAGKAQEFPVVVINDLHENWLGTIRVRLLSEGAVVQEKTLPCEVPALGDVKHKFVIDLPFKAGKYQIEAALIKPGIAPVCSLRDLQIIENKGKQSLQEK